MKKLNNKFHFFILLIFVSTSMLAQIPADLMENCKQWKITYPTGEEDKTLCNEPNNEYFYLNNTGDAIVFYAPIRNNNGTTPNSSYIRSELRERVADGSVDIYWTTEGSHVLYVKQAITHLPINKPELVAAQIHGNKDDGIDDSMVLRLEGTHLFLSFNGGQLRDDLTIKTDYVLGTKHEIIFKIVDGKHYCYYSEDNNLKTAYKNGTASSYLIKDGSNDYVMDLSYDETYFKVGNYTQSNPEKEGNDTNNPENYGEVLVYDFFVEHGAVGVNGVSLTPASLDLSISGSYQFSESVSPTNATNLDVIYSSSNESVATVSATGLVTAISSGTATITVTTIDGSFTDTSTIFVYEAANGTNLALNKVATGTGTHDADNKVENIIDGLTSTRWSVSGFPQTAIIDLGGIYSVGRTELVCYNDRAYQFTVSISDTENGAYTNIVDRSNNTTPGLAANPIINEFDSTNGRFIKITTTGAAYYTGSWVSLSEFKIYEASSLNTENNAIKGDEISIWPNPATQMIQISTNGDFKSVAVYDQIGKLIIKQDIKSESLDISSLKPGIYILHLHKSNSIIKKRFIKN